MLKHDSKPSFVRLTRVNGRAAASPFGNGHFNTTPGPGWTPCLPIHCSSIVIELSSCNRRVSTWDAYLKMLMRRSLSHYIRFLYTIATRLFIRKHPLDCDKIV